MIHLSPVASADHLSGKEGWNVAYTAGGKLESNFHTDEYSDSIKGLQPGDDITFSITLKNENAQDADWYMTNKVIHSLEDESKFESSGGAYTYVLTYTSPSQTRVLFSSDTVGGEGEHPSGVGLHGATNALKDYFYLDTLKHGETAQVTLKVALEGESQGNRYQDTLADLTMNFAVTPHGSDTVRTVVNTGDDAQLFPLYLAMMLSGAGILVLTMLKTRQRRSEH